VGSLFLPGILTKTKALHGIYILTNGWMGPFVLEFAWYGNPLYFAAAWFILRDRVKLARASASLAVALALTSLFASQWWFNEGYGTDIEKLGLGFYVWLSALGLMLLASILKVRLI
jgi:hypothetical protein